VVDEFEVTTEGDQETTNFVGSVVAMRLSDGVYVWTVRFGDGDTRDYEAEELATVVRRAHFLGVNVTG
jgi:hypothetical protein